MLKINRNIVAPVLFLLTLGGLILTQSFTLDMQSHLLYGATSLIILATAIFGKLNPELKFGKEEVFLTLFLVFFMISLAFKGHPFGFEEFVTFSMGTLVYFIFANTDTRKIDEKITLWTLVAVGTLFSAFGLFEFVMGPGDRLAGIFMGDFVYSNFPNAMATLLIIIIPLNYLIFIRDKKRRILSYLLLLINTTAIFLTFSRGIYIVLAMMLGFAIGIHFIYEKSFKKIIKNILIATSILAISALASYGLNSMNNYALDVSDRVTTDDISSKRSLDERFEFWEGAVKIAQENPLTGVGPGGFQHFYPQHQKSLLGLSTHPHNIILKILSESGYPAAATFLMFLALIFVKAIWELIWIRKKQSTAFAAIFIIFSGVTAHSMIDYNLNFTILSLAYFAIIGLIENQYTWEEVKIAEKPKDLGVEAPLLKAIFVALALGIFVTTIIQGIGYWNLKKAQYELEDDNIERAAEIIPKARTQPFKNGYHTIMSEILFGLNNPFLEDVLEAAQQKYPEYHPIIFTRALLTRDPQLIEEALELNPKNDLRYHLLKLQASENPRQHEEQYLRLLNDYTFLLSTNTHQTVATGDPEAADRMYRFFLGIYSDNPQKLEKWQNTHNKFMLVWQSEIDKFNQRFNTELTTTTFDEALNRYF